MSSKRITLSTGRVIEANEGLIGINEKLEVRQGYDSRINGLCVFEHEDEEWTVAEKVELANRMIALWEQFKHSNQ